MLIKRSLNIWGREPVEKLLITCLFFNRDRQSSVAHLIMHRFQFRESPLFYSAFPLVMGNPGTLFRLNGIVPANIDKRFDDKIKGIDIIVEQDQLAQMLSLFILMLNRFYLFFDHKLMLVMHNDTNFFMIKSYF